MHNITIIGGSGHQCLMNIDGIEIKLSKRNNKIDITDSEKVSAVIDEIAYLLGNNKPLYDLPKKLCAANIIRIMDAFFYEVVLNYWSTEFESHFNGRRSEFLKIFFGCFGFTHAFYNKTRLMVRIRQF
ncbi:MAG: hypothetical protein JJE49_10085, partial [Peptostreptococcaceae bacterium]|nr:hypothetical protein [Peptostreptococcaceae bacterium]